MKPRDAAFLMILVLALYLPLAARGTVRVFADRNAFAYAVTNSPQSIVNFDSYPEGPISGTEFTNSGFLFSSPLSPPPGQLEVAPGDFFWSSRYLNIGKRPYAGGDDGENDSLNVQILGDWTATALDFVDTSFPGNAIMTITFCGNASNVIYTVSAQNRNFAFMGIIADEPIRRIYIGEPGSDGDDVAYDNFVLANPPPVTVEPPVLSIVATQSGLVLKWPGAAGDYVLETAESVGSGGWQTFQQTPVFQDGFFTVTVQIEAGNRYFRLRKAD